MNLLSSTAVTRIDKNIIYLSLIKKEFDDSLHFLQKYITFIETFHSVVIIFKTLLAAFNFTDKISINQFQIDH